MDGGRPFTRGGYFVGQKNGPLAAVAAAAASLCSIGLVAALAQPSPSVRVAEVASAAGPIRATAAQPVQAPTGRSTTTFTAPPTSVAVVPPLAAAPARPAPARVTREQLPLGKGMWIYEPARTEFGNVNVIVGRAKDVGLSHIWVRTGSTWDGFNAGPFLAALLPKAHAAGLKVFGWDFPRLIDTKVDVARAMQAVSFQAPGGHRIDGFGADIETSSEGTHIGGARAREYGDRLRWAVGGGYPLIAVVPRPSPEQKGSYPYADVTAQFDGIAPMVYWLNRQPDTDVAGALRDLAKFHKPIFPIGQAYDGGREGGRPGVPPRRELMAFMDVAARNGAAGVSFWVWQQANQETWGAIRDHVQFAVDKLR